MNETHDLTRPPLAFDTNEAARQLGVSRSTLYCLLQSGELASVRIGRRRLVPAVALDEYLERLLLEARP